MEQLPKLQALYELPEPLPVRQLWLSIEGHEDKSVGLYSSFIPDKNNAKQQAAIRALAARVKRGTFKKVVVLRHVVLR